MDHLSKQREIHSKSIRKGIKNFVEINKQRSKKNRALMIFKVIRDRFKRDLYKKMRLYTKVFNLQRKEFLRVYAYFYALCYLSEAKTLDNDKDKVLQCHGIEIGILKNGGFP